jgi:hypothetical protein
MDDFERLINKLRHVEQLHARTPFAGERDAAQNAIDLIRERLRNCEEADPPIEYKFTLADMWSRKLLAALLRRYGIEPYRYRRQRHTTVMARVSKTFVDETLWPEFVELSDALEAYLAEITDRVIQSAISKDGTDVTVQSNPAAITLK